MAKYSIRDLDLKDQRVFVRVDFNVPIKGGTITDDTRITSSLPTIEHALAAGATVILASHLGRPKGKPTPEFSLRPVAVRLGQLLDRDQAGWPTRGLAAPVDGPVAGHGERPGLKGPPVAPEPPQPADHRHPGVGGQILGCLWRCHPKVAEQGRLQVPPQNRERLFIPALSGRQQLRERGPEHLRAQASAMPAMRRHSVMPPA